MMKAYGATKIKQLLLDSLNKKEMDLVEGDYDYLLFDSSQGMVKAEKSGARLTLSKQSKTPNEITTDFEFNFRLERNRSKIELWPISFYSEERGKLTAEIEKDGRRLTNTTIQNELIDLADNWGSSLTAQELSKRLKL